MLSSISAQISMEGRLNFDGGTLNLDGGYFQARWTDAFPPPPLPPPFPYNSSTEYGYTLSEMRDSFVLMSRANLLNRFSSCYNFWFRLKTYGLEKSLRFEIKFSSNLLYFFALNCFYFFTK